MKKIILILVPILLLGAYGYFQATGKIIDGDYPVAVVEPSYYDFGEMAMEDVVEYDFVLRNEGEGVLEVRNIATSCGCAKAELEENIIAPGESTILKVIYEPALMSSHTRGEGERIVYLRTNDPVNPQVEVKIKAYVK